MNVPQLRFDGFDGEWESINLGSISDVTKLAGFEFTAHINYSDEGEVIALRGLNVKNGRLNLENVKYIDGSNFEKLSRSKLVENDLLFTYVGTIGEVAIIDENEKYYLAPNVARIRVNLEEVDSLFLMTLISSQKFYFKTIFPLIATSSQPALSMSNIRKFEVSKPSLKEQLKIATFFSLINKKIEKQQEKIVRLEQFKKGMMQKIFSQELRFKDEDGGEFPEWEETTLGEVSVSMQYGMNAAAKEFDGENKYIRITDIDESSRRYIERGKVSPLGKLTEEYRVKRGDILFARTGASTGKSYLYKESDGKMYYAGFLIRLRVREGVDSRFVYYQTLLKEYDQWVKVMSMRSGQPGINAQEYSSYEFSLPSIDEQIRIADFLEGIENKIEKEREKLMVLEAQKKGFMQGMFV